MSIMTEQKYVVRLSIQATATDASDAVQDVLDQVLHGGLENFTYSVEEVGAAEQPFELPTHHGDVKALAHAWGVPENCVDSSFRGEFLG
ncbi:hypothetical protein [Pengzhenrongella sp.]|jgi:hypothetical protein|uniref:hypothetical protein n=1 Tax=Pengzhenrongella sp. TaxID=2888820 RepID=UPI002F925328